MGRDCTAYGESEVDSWQGGDHPDLDGPNLPLRGRALRDRVRHNAFHEAGACAFAAAGAPPAASPSRPTISDGGDVEVAGHVVQKGFVVMTLLAAANRDPAVIEDPDRFDVGRSEIPLLSFSSGIHYCLGASLARLEAQVVLAGLLDRFSTWTLLEESPPWKPRLTLRGPARLPVALS